MALEKIKIKNSITWKRLRNRAGELYQWGDWKSKATDRNWSKSNIIYRWVNNSTGQIVVIGEAKTKLMDRVNNYTSASKSSAGATNRRVFQEQQKLQKKSNYLYLEFTDEVPGYNLSKDRERKLAESLLIGYYKPYLQFNSKMRRGG